MDRGINSGLNSSISRGFEKRAVDPAAALKQEFLDAEDVGELRHRAGRSSPLGPAKI